MPKILLHALRTPIALAAFATALAVSPAAAQVAGAYTVTNILSDGSVPAAVTDSSFLNPWAVSVSGTWWISTANSGYNYAVPASGTPSFKVIVPATNGTSNGTPTGSVTTGGSSTTSFILPNGTKASFLFSTLDGTISGWNSKLGTTNALSTIVLNNTAAGAKYNGLAILNGASASYLLAPNFGAAAKVEVYDSNFKPATLAGTFTDPNLPSGYAPYSIHILNSQVFVTYAVRPNAAPYVETVAPGNGILDIYDLTGVLLTRAITGGNLNAPWGVAFAPSTFGVFANDLLVGNFGDGIINVFDPKTYAYLGQLMDGTGKTLVYPSLWELLAAATPVLGSTSVSGGTAGSVYFTAGLTNEAHGLFAAIANDAITAGSPNFGSSVSSSSLTVAAGSSVKTTLSITPIYNFSGSLALSCNNLPVGVTCSFSPATLPVTGTVPALAQVTITTSKATSQTSPLTPANGIAFALALPLLGLGILQKRKALRLTLVAVFGITLAAMATGCSTNISAPSPVTPTGAQSLYVQINSGAIVKLVQVNLTVQ